MHRGPKNDNVIQKINYNQVLGPIFIGSVKD